MITVTLHWEGHSDLVVHEANGRSLAPYTDPVGRFTVSCSETDDVRFHRYRGADGTEGASVILYNPTDEDRKFVSVEISGDFSAAVELPKQFAHTRWRWNSWGTSWPFPFVKVSAQ